MFPEDEGQDGCGELYQEDDQDKDEKLQREGSHEAHVGTVLHTPCDRWSALIL